MNIRIPREEEGRGEGVWGGRGAVYEYDSDREVRKSPEKVL